MLTVQLFLPILWPQPEYRHSMLIQLRGDSNGVCLPMAR